MATKVSGLTQLLKIEDTTGTRYFNKTLVSVKFKAGQVIIGSELQEVIVSIPLADFQDGNGTPITTQDAIAAYLGGLLEASGGGISIEDAETGLKKVYTETIVATGVSGLYGLDPTLGDTWDLTLTGGTDLFVPNPPTGTKTVTLFVLATGGNISLPGGTNYVAGSYDGSKINWIVIKILNGKRVITITQPD